MAAVRPPAHFHRGWIHWVMYTLGGGLGPSSGRLLRCKHKRENVKSSFISHDLSSAANFHSAHCNRDELPAAFKPTRMLGPSIRSTWRYVRANERAASVFNLSAGFQEHEIIFLLVRLPEWEYHIIRLDLSVFLSTIFHVKTLQMFFFYCK